MAASVKPSDWFGAGYASSSSAHTVTLNSVSGTPGTLAQLSDANADPTTGNAEMIITAFMELFLAAYIARKAADNPKNVKVTKGPNIDPSTGNQVLTYTVQIQTNPPSGQITPVTET